MRELWPIRQCVDQEYCQREAKLSEFYKAINSKEKARIFIDILNISDQIDDLLKNAAAMRNITKVVIDKLKKTLSACPENQAYLKAFRDLPYSIERLIYGLDRNRFIRAEFRLKCIEAGLARTFPTPLPLND